MVDRRDFPVVVAVIAALAGAAAFFLFGDRTSAVRIALGALMVCASVLPLAIAMGVRLRATPSGQPAPAGTPLATASTGLGGMAFGVGLLLVGRPPAALAFALVGAILLLVGGACALKKV